MAKKGPREEPQSKAEIFQHYEKALQLIYQKKYAEARDLLLKLEEEFPKEIEVLARARQWLKVCERRLQGNSPPPLKTPLEAYEWGVWLHNRGAFEEAVKVFEKALQLSDPKKDEVDYIHYALAASLARLGQGRKARQQLSKAIELNRENRFLARNDSDFAGLRESAPEAELDEVTQA